MPFAAACSRNMSTIWSRNSGELHVVAVEPQQAVLDLRDVEQAVDEARHVLGAAPDHADRVVRRAGDAALQQLRVAEDRIERRAHLVAHADDVARLRDVRGFGGFLRLLQRCVGALVRFDFLHQHGGLARGFRLGGAPALVREHDAPGHDARQHQQAKYTSHSVLRMASRSAGDDAAVLVVDEREQQADGEIEQHQQPDELPARACCSSAPTRFGSTLRDEAVELLGEPAVLLAHVVAARFERAAQRADRARSRPGTSPCRCARTCSRRCVQRISVSLPGNPLGWRAR